MRDNKEPGAWQRCRQRNKGKKPAKSCSCPVTGVSTTCKVKLHSQRAKDLQSVGLSSQIPVDKLHRAEKHK